ncbi:hypothetical protein B0H14DRAFT_2416357, partial [Mycena olivaceomarginata]
RTLFYMSWNCITTISLCIWLSFHPNVPPPNQAIGTRVGQTLRMTMISLVAPEVMLGFAARQYFVARWFARENNVSLTHSFFLVMGGFVTRNGHNPIVIRARPQLSQYLGKIAEIKEEDIRDKSKGDTLLKLLTVLQVIRFVVACIIRQRRGVTILGFENATAGLAFIHICMWVLWRKKPPQCLRSNPSRTCESF